MTLTKVILIIIGILILIIGNVMVIHRDNSSWKVIIKTALLISNNDKNVSSLIESSKNDSNLKLNESNFNQKALAYFEKNGSYYNFIDEDTDAKEYPFCIFKTTMIGYEYMSYIDWKDISDPENMIWVVNNLLKTQKLKNLSRTEISTIENRVNPILAEPYSLKKAIQATNAMIEVLDEIMYKRDYRVLWYIEISDSYSFFIVKPEIFKLLNNTKLDDEHEFKTPKFNLNGEFVN